MNQHVCHRDLLIPNILTKGLSTDPNLYALQSSKKCKPQPTTPSRFAYVEAIVDINALAIESIWNNIPLESRVSPVVPLRTFIQEVLKRSRTTYSTLQTALYYLFRAKTAILRHLTSETMKSQAYVSCGRRMFLASLVVASKFVQDKTYRNSAWAKIAGLPISEINMAERCFLQLLDYQLYIDQITFDSWHRQLHRHSQAHMEGLPISIHDLDYLSFTPPSPPSPIIEYNNTSMYGSDSPCPPLSLSASSSISSSPALTPPLASKRKLETIESFMNKKHCRLWQ